MRPVGGFRSLREGVKALLAEGLGREDIALRLGVSGDAVRGTINDLRAAGLEVPHGQGGWRKGQAHSEETREKIAATLRARNTGQKVSSSQLAAVRPVQDSAASPGRRGLEISARTRVRYRLRDPDGDGWLHLSGTGLTSVEAYAWIGFAHQLAALRNRHPELKAFRAVEVQPDATRSARSNGPAGGMLRGGVLS